VRLDNDGSLLHDCDFYTVPHTRLTRLDTLLTTTDYDRHLRRCLCTTPLTTTLVPTDYDRLWGGATYFCFFSPLGKGGPPNQRTLGPLLLNLGTGENNLPLLTKTVGGFTRTLYRTLTRDRPLYFWPPDLGGPDRRPSPFLPSGRLPPDPLGPVWGDRTFVPLGPTRGARPTGFWTGGPSYHDRGTWGTDHGVFPITRFARFTGKPRPLRFVHADPSFWTTVNHVGGKQNPTTPNDDTL